MTRTYVFRDNAAAEMRVRELWNIGKSRAEIADALTAEGHPCSEKNVSNLVTKYSLPVRRVVHQNSPTGALTDKERQKFFDGLDRLW